jgi:gamma-glutamylcyclotransferase (GGCT)/AIG2-like uncharacterized protein YtfP
MRALPGTPERRRLFAYGTLVVPRVMEAVTGRTFPGRPAVLEGYARFLVAGTSYPGIVCKPGERTEGVLYHGLGRRDLEALDRFEDAFYERRVVFVTGPDGARTPAHAYVVPRRHRRVLGTDPWRRDVFETEHLAGFLAGVGGRLAAKSWRERRAASPPGLGGEA